MINGERLLQNIDEIYVYRSIDDESVFMDENMRRLVMNYGSGFVRAATYLAEKGEYQKASEYIERARVFVDDDIRLTEFYTRFYSGSGDWDAWRALWSKLSSLIHAAGESIYPMCSVI
ncbi:MAG: hypothetical protein LRZ88_12705 [Candidatus Cloacimonetes bacterium]|nr:hypothetical protein [Candidatus Cloacimonadota bacterium]